MNSNEMARQLINHADMMLDSEERIKENLKLLCEQVKDDFGKALISLIRQYRCENVSDEAIVKGIPMLIDTVKEQFDLFVPIQRRLLVSVDFDGTITQSSDPQDSGFNKIRPNCFDTMVALHKMGIDFVLLTGRRPEWIDEAVNLCEEWNLPIDTSHPNTKVICDYYIDDRNFGCDEINWKKIYKYFKEKLDD